MSRGRGSSALASPVLVGAVTTLVVVVAVFLAYNANSGLPFVPTKVLRVQVTSGANLVPGNEVRSGGFRVGLISSMEPTRFDDGRVGAVLDLKLDSSIGDIPRDTTAVIRARSALGLKYLELEQGTAKESFADGDTLPVLGSSNTTDLDEVLSIFDEPTREAAKRNLEGFGDAFTARGPSLNRTIEALPELFEDLEPVMANLADPDTQLERFFGELADTTRVIAPVADVQGPLFRDQATTFEAIGRDPEALKATISKTPPTLDSAIRSFRVQRPFLTEFAALSGDLSSAAGTLRSALPDVNSALVKGTDVQRRLPELNERLEGVFAALETTSKAPGTNAGLRGLSETGRTLNTQVRFYGPYVTVCNYWNSWWTFLAEHFAEPNSTGSAQRALVNSTGRQQNSLGSMGAFSPANGEGVQEGAAQFAQDQPYTAAVDGAGAADCEAGQRGFLTRNAAFYPDKFDINRDARSPGLQGPTFTGRPRVPAGQTFVAVPETGPYKDYPYDPIDGQVQR